MKNLFTFLILLLLTQNIFAQERYLDEVFSGVDVTLDVEYSANTNFPLLTFFDSPMPLLMDVYEPANDTVLQRPVVVMLHDGNLLANMGSKLDVDVVEIANRLARMGYVVVSIDYRVGWDLLATTQAERAKSLMRAFYRAMQDSRSCNRYLRHSVNNLNNPYSIDTNRMVIWGNGMGSNIAYMAATLDDANELDILPLMIANDNMIDEDIDGNINGTSVGLSLEGDTINHINYPGFSSDFHLSVNLQGYLIDTSWIDQNSLAMISYFRPDSYFCDFDTLTVSGNPNLNVSAFHGPCNIIEQISNLGINDVLADDLWLDSVSTIANTNNNGLIGLYSFQGNGTITSSAHIDTVIQYFAPRAYKALDLGLCPIDFSVLNGIDFGTINSNDTVYQTFSIINTGTTAFSIEDIFSDLDNLIINFDTTTIAPMDTIEITIGVFLEGGEELNEFINLTFSNGEQIEIILLGNGDWVNAIESTVLNNIRIFPNPSNGNIQLDLTGFSQGNNPILITIYDVVGKIVGEQTVENSTTQSLDLTALESGIYLIKLDGEQGSVLKKITVF